MDSNIFATIVNPKINDVDVFTITSDQNNAFVNFIKIKSGSIIQTQTLELKKALNETDEQLLCFAIVLRMSKFCCSYAVVWLCSCGFVSAF